MLKAVKGCQLHLLSSSIKQQGFIGLVDPIQHLSEFIRKGKSIMGEFSCLPLPNQKNILTSSKAILEFEYIICRNESAKQTFSVYSNSEEQGKIVSDAPWLLWEPKTFTQGSTDVSVQLITEMFEQGKQYEAHIILLLKEMCLSIPIYVETDSPQTTDTERKRLIDAIIDEKALTTGFFLDYFEKSLKRYNEMIKMVEPLVNALRDEDSLVRSNAAWALGKVGDVEVVEHLMQALIDKDPRVRQSAARSLGELGATEAVEHLVNALRDEDSLVRSNAAWALGKVGDVEVVEHLMQALIDKDPGVRQSAARSLGEMASFIQNGMRSPLSRVEDSHVDISSGPVGSFDNYIQSLIKGMTPYNYYHLPVGGELL